MGFASMPSYLDPANWQPQPNSGASTQLLPPPPPPPPPQPNHVGTSTIRPGSMADRARNANMGLPSDQSAALKCPRCDSSNTKFCYFNNYSLSQPRHFCKTCRRYWTRGGALRNVPVGGGCRRNKRTKSSSNSSSKGGPTTGSSSTSAAVAAATPTNSTGSSDLLFNGGHLMTSSSQIVHQPPPMPMPMRFNMSQFHHQLSDFGIGDQSTNIGLNSNNYGAVSVDQSSGGGELNFLLPNNNSTPSSHQLLSSGGITGNYSLEQSQWRIIPQMQQQQQFPFLAAGNLEFDPSSSRLEHLPFEVEGGASSGHLISYLDGDTRPGAKVSSVLPPMVSKLGLVKFEGIRNQNDQEVVVNHLSSRQFGGNDHQLYWNHNDGSSASAWATDLSAGFNNS